MDVNGSGGAPPDCLELRPTRAAKVSEISEATASSAIAPEDRVNFHIGNPVQESRLSSAISAPPSDSISGTRRSRGKPGADSPGDGHGGTERPALEFLASLVRRSAPYLPGADHPQRAPSPCDGLQRLAPEPAGSSRTTWGRRRTEGKLYSLPAVSRSARASSSMRFPLPGTSSGAHPPLPDSLPVHVMSFKGLRSIAPA